MARVLAHNDMLKLIALGDGNITETFCFNTFSVCICIVVA